MVNRGDGRATTTPNNAIRDSGKTFSLFPLLIAISLCFRRTVNVSRSCALGASEKQRKTNAGLQAQSTRDSSTPLITHELCVRWRALLFVPEINQLVGVEGFLKNLEMVPGAVCVLSTARINYLAREVVRTATYSVKFPSLERNAEGSGGSFEAAKHIWELELARCGLAAERYDIGELAKTPARTARSISSVLKLAKLRAKTRGELPTMADLEFAEEHQKELVESNGGGPAPNLYQ